MKNVYFVQVGFGFDGSVYLPYAVGTIIANCMRYEEITSEYAFPDIIFCREKLADALKKIVDPYLVAFSCSVWNMEYNKALASRIKEKYPDCLISFGGHSVKNNGELLDEVSQVDILNFGEGEEVIALLLKGLKNGDISGVPSIAYRENGETVKTPRAAPCDLSALPSPYLTGVFDKLLEENPGREFLSVLETNRGCPYKCAYCDWVTDKRMRFFPMEKIKAEIRWLGEHRIAYCFCGDSNFGMYDRDIEIAECLVATKRELGFPEVFRPCYEKNSADRVFKICSILNREGMDKGATLAYQTLSDVALKNIGRKNLTMEHFSALVKRYIDAGIPCYSELILGLPGETKESFCRGICRLLESGQHNSLNVYHCEMLPNAEMSDPDYVKKYGIDVIKVGFNHIHSAPERDEEVPEYSYLIRSTNTMSREDWVQANLFSVCVQTFHALGILRYFAIYLFTEQGISYYDFYTDLLSYIMEGEGMLHDLWEQFREKYESNLSGEWNYHNPDFGHVTWFFEEGAFLEIVRDLPAAGKLLEPFLKRYSIPGDLYENLKKYQKTMLRKPFDKGETVRFDYDLHTYFNGILGGEPRPLEKKRVALTVAPRTVYTDMFDYAKETVWYGRRRGASIYSRREAFVSQGDNPEEGA
ncbi:MAG: radical SAM protein [Clostridia bacterium]|nr:radical SAM protein [Clostridia bacterium]